jgi:DNA (cytosine-5)-methyltransferase 1
MFRLIRECQPVTVFGEQVASAIGHGWLDGISDDLEGETYAVGSIVLGAFSVGAPHKRARLYWVADSGCVRNHGSRDGGIEASEGVWRGQSATGRNVDTVGQSDSNGRRQRVATSQVDGYRDSVESAGRVDAVGDTSKSGLEGRPSSRRANEWSAWSASVAINCLDGKSRRVGCGVQPLVNGIPRSLGRGKPELSRLAKRARANRVGRLKGYGNAIVPQVAAEFVMACMDCSVNK